jgi:diacylglycerol kinase (ATP)
MMSDQNRLGIIMNPMAGRGKVHRIESHLIKVLQSKRIAYTLEKTNAPGDAVHIARHMSKTISTVVAVGGDGTVNEVVNGLVGSTAKLGVLPIGSGNDFNRTVGMPKNLHDALDIIVRGANKKIDLGKITIKNSAGSRQARYFINTLGIGIDAQIAKEVKTIKLLQGLPLYLLAAFKALATYKINKYHITDHQVSIRDERAFLICAGNGSYEGGGFKMLPDAINDDGLLDICLIRAMPILKSLPVIAKIIKGTHSKETKIEIWKSRYCKIESGTPFILHGDGEIFEENAIEAILEIAEEKMTVVAL